MSSGDLWTVFVMKKEYSSRTTICNCGLFKKFQVTKFSACLWSLIVVVYIFSSYYYYYYLSIDILIVNEDRRLKSSSRLIQDFNVVLI